VEVEITIDDPQRPEVRRLVERHLSFSYDVTPPGHVHALPLEGLVDPNVTFFAARSGADVVAIGALKHVDDAHAELKSMHTSEAVRGQGVGAAMVAHLLAFAADAGYRRVSLETGAGQAFAPAHRLYERFGFERCEPFGDYTANEHSVCLTLVLPPSSHRDP
jgi:putative acetyltransferase